MVAPLEPCGQRLSQPVEILHVLGKRDRLQSLGSIAAPPATVVEVDDADAIREIRKHRMKAHVRIRRASGQEHEGRAVALFLYPESRAVDGNVAAGRMRNG